MEGGKAGGAGLPTNPEANACNSDVPLYNHDQRSHSPLNHGYRYLPPRPTKNSPIQAVPASDPGRWDEDGGDSLGQIGGEGKGEKAQQRSSENAQTTSVVCDDEEDGRDYLPFNTYGTSIAYLTNRSGSQERSECLSRESSATSGSDRSNPRLQDATCDFCGKNFTSSAALQTHFHMAHSGGHEKGNSGSISRRDSGADQCKWGSNTPPHYVSESMFETSHCDNSAFRRVQGGSRSERPIRFRRESEEVMEHMMSNNMSVRSEEQEFSDGSYHQLRRHPGRSSFVRSNSSGTLVNAGVSGVKRKFVEEPGNSRVHGRYRIGKRRTWEPCTPEYASDDSEEEARQQSLMQQRSSREVIKVQQRAPTSTQPVLTRMDSLRAFENRCSPGTIVSAATGQAWDGEEIDGDNEDSPVLIKKRQLALKLEELERAEAAVKQQEEEAQHRTWLALHQQEMRLRQREEQLRQREAAAQRKMEMAARLLEESTRLDYPKLIDDRELNELPQFIRKRPSSACAYPNFRQHEISGRTRASDTFNGADSSVGIGLGTSRSSATCDTTQHLHGSTPTRMLTSDLIISENLQRSCVSPHQLHTTRKSQSASPSSVTQGPVVSRVDASTIDIPSAQARQTDSSKNSLQHIHPDAFENIPSIEPAKISRTYYRRNKLHNPPVKLHTDEMPSEVSNHIPRRSQSISPIVKAASNCPSHSTIHDDKHEVSIPQIIGNVTVTPLANTNHTPKPLSTVTPQQTGSPYQAQHVSTPCSAFVHTISPHAVIPKNNSPHPSGTEAISSHDRSIDTISPSIEHKSVHPQSDSNNLVSSVQSLCSPDSNERSSVSSSISDGNPETPASLHADAANESENGTLPNLTPITRADPQKLLVPAPHILNSALSLPKKWSSKPFSLKYIGAFRKSAHEADSSKNSQLTFRSLGGVSISGNEKQSANNDPANESHIKEEASIPNIKTETHELMRLHQDAPEACQQLEKEGNLNVEQNLTQEESSKSPLPTHEDVQSPISLQHHSAVSGQQPICTLESQPLTVFQQPLPPMESFSSHAHESEEPMTSTQSLLRSTIQKENESLNIQAAATTSLSPHTISSCQLIVPQTTTHCESQPQIHDQECESSSIKTEQIDTNALFTQKECGMPEGLTSTGAILPDIQQVQEGKVFHQDPQLQSAMYLQSSTAGQQELVKNYSEPSASHMTSQNQAQLVDNLISGQMVSLQHPQILGELDLNTGTFISRNPAILQSILSSSVTLPVGSSPSYSQSGTGLPRIPVTQTNTNASIKEVTVSVQGNSEELFSPQTGMEGETAFSENKFQQHIPVSTEQIQENNIYFDGGPVPSNSNEDFCNNTLDNVNNWNEENISGAFVECSNTQEARQNTDNDDLYDSVACTENSGIEDMNENVQTIEDTVSLHQQQEQVDQTPEQYLKDHDFMEDADGEENIDIGVNDEDESDIQLIKGSSKDCGVIHKESGQDITNSSNLVLQSEEPAFTRETSKDNMCIVQECEKYEESLNQESFTSNNVADGVSFSLDPLGNVRTSVEGQSSKGDSSGTVTVASTGSLSNMAEISSTEQRESRLPHTGNGNSSVDDSLESSLSHNFEESEMIPRGRGKRRGRRGGKSRGRGIGRGRGRNKGRSGDQLNDAYKTYARINRANVNHNKVTEMVSDSQQDCRVNSLNNETKEENCSIGNHTLNKDSTLQPADESAENVLLESSSIYNATLDETIIGKTRELPKENACNEPRRRKVSIMDSSSETEESVEHVSRGGRKVRLKDWWTGVVTEATLPRSRTGSGQKSPVRSPIRSPVRSSKPRGAAKSPTRRRILFGENEGSEEQKVEERNREVKKMQGKSDKTKKGRNKVERTGNMEVVNNCHPANSTNDNTAPCDEEENRKITRRRRGRRRKNEQVEDESIQNCKKGNKENEEGEEESSISVHTQEVEEEDGFIGPLPPGVNIERGLKGPMAGEDIAFLEKFEDTTEPEETEKKKPGRPRAKRIKKPAMVNVTPVENPGQNAVVCGRCELPFVSEKSFLSHSRLIHNGLARPKGQSQEFSDYEVKLIMVSTLKVLKQLRCGVCYHTFTSLIGYRQHVLACGVPPELLNIVCRVCQRKIRYYYFDKHMKEKHALNEYALETTGEETLTRGTRKAAANCKARLQAWKSNRGHDETSNAGDEEEFHLKNVSKHYNESIQPLSESVMRTWEADLGVVGEVICPHDGCTLTFNSLPTASNHFSRCVFAPTSFKCRLCDFYCVDKAKIHAHITSTHCNEVVRQLESSESESSGDENEEEYKVLGRYSGHNKSSGCYRTPNNLFDPFIPALKMTVNFLSRNTSVTIFPEYTIQGNWQPLASDQTTPYVPSVTFSPKFRIEFVGEKKKSKTWQVLEMFHGVLEQGRGLFFAGGPITASAWCPLPPSISSTTCYQYLALHSIPDPDHEYKMQGSYTHAGLIQIWGFPQSKNKEEPPQFLLGIAHDYGNVWSLSWCPSGAYSTSDPKCSKSEKNLARLGLLAAGCSDGTVRIFSVPHPEPLNIGETSRICKPPPTLTLSPSTKVGIVQCFKVDWCRSYGHQFVVGAISSGVVCVWDVLDAATSLLSSKNSQGNTVLRPVQSWHAHHGACTAAVFCPGSSGRCVLTGGSDRTYKFWDLNDTDVPLSVMRKGLVLDAMCLPHWPGGFLAFDDVFGLANTNTCYRESGFFSQPTCNVLSANAPVWSLAGSDWLNTVVQGDSSGHVVITPQQQLFKYTDNDKFPSRRKLPLLSVQLHDADGNAPVSFCPVITKKCAESKSAKKQNKRQSNQYQTGEQNDEDGLCPVTFEEFPRSYAASKDTHALVFSEEDQTNFRNISEDHLITVRRSDAMSPGPVTCYPLAAISSLAWNNNFGAHTKVFVGTQAGFGRLLEVSALHTPDVHQFFTKVEKKLMKQTGNNQANEWVDVIEN
ncbi:hypothetical protein Pcinc_027956 [Petrolisthes cinctipes]|uniref:C2H2-type domain-containing protein n=1 Tax=Petrolisthes cinctipes TaxID=88211 RepID=A0AAE1K5Z5_PETCI|nr:hypothetical protein Pcinc_027956 [Petrolisthes cinctipes]